MGKRQSHHHKNKMTHHHDPGLPESLSLPPCPSDPGAKLLLIQVGDDNLRDHAVQPMDFKSQRHLRRAWPPGDTGVQEPWRSLPISSFPRLLLSLGKVRPSSGVPLMREYGGGGGPVP